MRDSVQKAINRMSRASLGVMKSTPVAFLESVGGSMPAVPRLQFRQACYAGRVAASEAEGIRDITAGCGELAQRLRASIPGGRAQDPAGLGPIVERTTPPRGRRFPGEIHLPSVDPGEDRKQERIDRAILFAREFETDDTAYWTDGSAFPGGVAAGAVATFVKRELLEGEIQRTKIVRRGTAGSERHNTRMEGKGRERTYKGAARSIIRAGNEEGMRAEAWTIRGGATAYDAELSALVRAIELCFLRRAPGLHFRIFTDSQAAMRRIQDDRPGPGQAVAVRGIVAATRAHRKGSTISIHWVPGHCGVVGNEVADQWASEAAEREIRTRGGSRPSPIHPPRECELTSRAFLRTVLRRKAMEDWRREIISRRKSRGPYRVPSASEVPRIPRALQRAGKSLASRFFQLASGHAFIAPFLRYKFGWVESDQCWWCDGGRQSRDHLFKECRTWKDQIRKLWKKVGEASGESTRRNKDKHKSKKRGWGFGLWDSGGMVRPGNCSMNRLFGDPRFTTAVLDFLEETDVGKIKRGVLIRGVAAE